MQIAPSVASKPGDNGSGSGSRIIMLMAGVVVGRRRRGGSRIVCRLLMDCGRMEAFRAELRAMRGAVMGAYHP